MTPSEIITEDMHRFGHSDDDVRRMFGVMKAALDKNMGLLLQKGNTVLFIHSMPKHGGELSLYTVDSPNAVKSALKYFISEVKKGGFKVVYGIDGGPELNKTLQLLKTLGIKVQNSNLPQYKWMAKL